MFRHALLRDAAYRCNFPATARLRGLALAIEDLCGGRPPEPPPLDAAEPEAFAPHATDAFAFELAGHVRRAVDAGVTIVATAALPFYLRRAAEVAVREFRAEAETCWIELAGLSQGALRAAALRSAGIAAAEGGRARPAEEHSGEAPRISREGGDRRGDGIALGNLAIVYRDTGRLENAERAYQEALALLRNVGDEPSLGTHTCELALCLLLRSRRREAEELWRQGTTILKRVAASRELKRQVLMRVISPGGESHRS